MGHVLDIWVDASVRAHGFIPKEFWELNRSQMRDTYLPASETYVYEQEGAVKGFLSLYDNTIAAIFVNPDCQGRGIGQQLMAKAKELRESLNLTVYKANTKSIEFYQKCGFSIVKEQVDDHTGHSELVMMFEKSL